VDDNGRGYPINDPLAPALARQLASAQALAGSEHGVLQAERRRVASLLSFAPVFGDLGNAAGFIDAVAAHRLSIRQQGVLATLAAVAAP
jgi:fructuronate reductase